jgi:glycosyltransferase involved in cell wall biosynthesis
LISIIIPVKNGGTDLVRCLQAIGRQRIDEPVEVVVVDSGSRDGTPDRARALGAQVHLIGADEFHHGRTRNLGANLASGNTLVFTSQDAYAADDSWLAHLTAPLLTDDSVAGVYGRQLPHQDATPPERYFLDFLYGPHARVQRLRDGEELSFEATLFSNVGSAMPRDVWERFPFAEDIVMSEDQEWSRRVLRAGKSIVYEPLAVVHHSHLYSLRGALRRFFDSGASADRSYVDGAGSTRALWKAAARYAQGEVEWLWVTGQKRWIPYAAVYELAKFTGLQLGRRHYLLPTALKTRISAYPRHWREQGESTS